MTAMARFAVTVRRPRGPGRRWRALLAAFGLVCAAHVAAQSDSTTLDLPDPAPEAAVEPAAGEETRIVTRFEAQLRMRRLMDADQFLEAAEFGPELVHLTEEEFGLKSVEAADAHVELADAERLAGEHEKAETSYLHALDVYREVDGQFSSRVIRPLVALGDNYEAAGDHTKAVSAYGEARAVSRRVYGLLDEGQIEILDRLTKSYERLGQMQEAQDQQLAALTLVERSYPPASPEVLDAIYKYALWLRASYRYNEEREQYYKADRMIREVYGETSVYLVRPLRERANSFRTQGVASSQGSGGLEDALELLEAQDEPDPRMLAELLRDMGDWEVAFARFGTDGGDYLRSWNLLADVSDGEALRQTWYDGIEFVLRAPLSRLGLTDDPKAPAGHVLVRFDITPEGHADNVTVIESEPPGLKDEAVARQVRLSRFRPNIEDGRIVLAQNQALDFQFRYVSDDEPKSKSESDD